MFTRVHQTPFTSLLSQGELIKDSQSRKEIEKHSKFNEERGKKVVCSLNAREKCGIVTPDFAADIHLIEFTQTLSQVKLKLFRVHYEKVCKTYKQ